ncbi:putative transcription factor C2H2 family [Medicago truncatula]|nr:putative transcription factor C2H2 family [Medicago truncatula]
MEESHVETETSKFPQKDIAEEESIDSPKEISPFLLFGFIVDQRKGIQNAYSCKFCSRKFTTPQALGGHQSAHKFERSLVKKRIQAFSKAWINYSNGNQGISLNNVTPFHMGCGCQCYGFNNMIQHAGSSNFYAGNLFGALSHIPHIDEVNEADQGILSHKVNMTEIEFGSILEGGVVSDEVDQEDNETQEEEASKIDLTLKL